MVTRLVKLHAKPCDDDIVCSISVPLTLQSYYCAASCGIALPCFCVACNLATCRRANIDIGERSSNRSGIRLYTALPDLDNDFSVAATLAARNQD